MGYYVAVALGILKRNAPEVIEKEENYHHTDSEYNGIFPSRNNLDNALGILHGFRSELSCQHCECVVGAVHQDGEFEGTGLIINIAEEAAYGKCGDSLPDIAMDGGKEDC